MCNGDLGMYRVMPWAYPTIPGQTAGGISVDPTPEPEPVPKGPYDFSDLSMNWKYRTYNYRPGGSNGDLVYVLIGYGINVTGGTVNDNSNVSSISIVIVNEGLSISPDSFTGNNGTHTVNNETFNLQIDKNLSSNGGGYVFWFTGQERVTSSYKEIPFTLIGDLKVKLVVYDLNGEVLQESEEITIGG